MIDVLRIAHLRIAPQEGNLEVGNCEGNLLLSSKSPKTFKTLIIYILLPINSSSLSQFQIVSPSQYMVYGFVLTVILCEIIST